MHVEVPPDSLYFPAPHAVQVPPADPVHPALQVQFVKDALPAGELEFDGQAVQRADPVDALYLPATHAMHVELAEDTSSPDPAR